MGLLPVHGGIGVWTTDDIVASNGGSSTSTLRGSGKQGSPNGWQGAVTGENFVDRIMFK